MRRRRRVVSALNKCCNQTHIENYNKKLLDIETEIKNSHSAELTHNETEAIRNIATNTKSFFSYARKKQKTQESIGPFLDKSTSEIISDETQIADRLQSQYWLLFSV